MADREWQTDPVEKFGDVASPMESVRHRLPNVDRIRNIQVHPTPDLEQRRQLQAPVIKKVSGR